MVPTPPSTAAGMVPNSAAVTPLSNWPSWLEALMNRKLTAPTRPRISSGVASCTSETYHHADRIGGAENRQRQHRQPHPLREREHHRRPAEHDHGLKHPQPDMAIDAVAGQHDGHQQRADRGRGAQDAQPERAGLQDVAGIDRQQRRDAAQQHGEQIERDGA